MTLQDAQYGDISLVLVLTPAEAQSGITRVLDLPNGRLVTVHIPPNTHEDDEIRIPGQGLSRHRYEARGDLVLHIQISHATQSDSLADPIKPVERPSIFAGPELGRLSLKFPETLTGPAQSELLASTVVSSEDSAQVAFPALPLTPVDLSELPTNPLIVSVVPVGFAPITPAIPTNAPVSSANNEVIASNSSPLLDPSQAQTSSIVSISRPLPFVPNEIIVADNASPIDPLNGQPLPATFPHPPYGSMPAQFLPAQPARRKRLDAKAILALCAAFLLLILSAGGLIFDLSYYKPHQEQVAATAKVNAQATGTARGIQTYVAGSYQTSVARQQATTTAFQNIYTQATSNRPFLNESLKQQTTSGWDTGQLSDGSSCTFKNGSYEVYMPDSGYFLPCFAENPTFTNFAFQVDINIVQGDSGGVTFRSDSYYGEGYAFGIDASGDYYLSRFTSKTTPLFNGQTDAFQSGKKNRLTVIATGTTFYFYLNQQFLRSTTDKTFGEGQIGLIADDYQQATIVDYNNLKVWVLP
jgi:hypothetical protein